MQSGGRFLRTWRYFQRNWEFAVQLIIGFIFVALLVADHFGRATLDSGTIGTTIVGLLLFASLRLTRQGDELRSVREHQEIQGDIEQIPGDRIGSVLNQLLANSDQWHFRGGSARWQLQKVLPSLASRRDMPSRYVMQVIDPLDVHLCERYGLYRATSRAKAEAPSVSDGPEEVKRDILACIYAAGWYRANSKVRPEIILLRSYSPLRVDCGTDGLMVTVANKATPGLFAAKGTWYYRSVLDEIEQLEEVSSRLVLPRGNGMYPATLLTVTGDEISTMLGQVLVESPDGSRAAFGPSSGLHLDDAALAAIAERVQGAAS
jgi:hypothetical protein